MICYIHNFHVIATCNYGLLSAELECLASQLFGNNNQELAPLLETINNVQDLQFLKQSVSSLLLKLGSSNLGYTAADLTDFLMEINQEKSLDNLKKKVCQYFSQLFRKQTGMTPSAYVAKLHNTGT